jgi:hypothetical protein
LNGMLFIIHFLLLLPHRIVGNIENRNLIIM